MDPSNQPPSSTTTTTSDMHNKRSSSLSPSQPTTTTSTSAVSSSSQLGSQATAAASAAVNAVTSSVTSSAQSASKGLQYIWSQAQSKLAGSQRLASDFIKKRFGGPLTVVVAGESGLGKSTLINQVFGFDLAKAGAGKPVTTKARLYSDEYIRVVDSVGFLRGVDTGAQFFDGDLLLKMVDPQRQLQGKGNEMVVDIEGVGVKEELRFDMVWYFLDRFQPEDERVLKSLMFMNIPFLVIIAKCDAKKKHDVETLRSQIKSSLVFPEFITSPPATSNPSQQTPTYEIVEMRNPQTGPTICEECESPTVKKPRPDGKGFAYYCSNETCEFFQDMYIAVVDTKSLAKSLKDLNSAVETLLARTMHVSRVDGREVFWRPAYLRRIVGWKDAAAVGAVGGVRVGAVGGATAGGAGHRLMIIEWLRGDLCKTGTVDRFRRAQLISISSKTQLATIPIVTAVLASVTIGLTPIPFSDAPLLIATQSVMVACICAIYGINISDDGLKGFFYVVLGAGLTPIIGLSMVNILRFLPGVGTIAAAAIEAPVAASLTLALGIVVMKICRTLVARRLDRTVVVAASGGGTVGSENGGGGTAEEEEAHARPKFEFDAGEVKRMLKEESRGVYGRVKGVLSKNGASGDKKVWKRAVEGIVEDSIGGTSNYKNIAYELDEVHVERSPAVEEQVVVSESVKVTEEVVASEPSTTATTESANKAEEPATVAKGGLVGAPSSEPTVSNNEPHVETEGTVSAEQMAILESLDESTRLIEDSTRRITARLSMSDLKNSDGAVVGVEGDDDVVGVDVEIASEVSSTEMELDAEQRRRLEGIFLKSEKEAEEDWEAV
ncbi:hypothetical protein HDU76_001155 [Blyttiomyces sp. JEL0837]|nr:hypothetical protein HDU76_001155 [Blyttiomyces sp. JEL0837]